jgi:leader peptidase (prepilin peptidase)/N-methyltransferase
VRIAEAAAVLSVLGWAGALTVFDLAQRRLPNVLTLGGAAVILAGAACAGRGMPALLGAAALAGPYLVVHLADPAALGGGDVKLAFAVGGLTGALGLPVWALAAIGAPLLTAAAGVVLAVGRLVGRSSAATLPHGPSLCAASLAAAALAVL